MLRIIKPPHGEHYPYEPYEFESRNEVLNYVKRAIKESIDSLYLQAKQIAADYNDQKEDKVNLLAIEIISSYFQDRFPTIGCLNVTKSRLLPSLRSFDIQAKSDIKQAQKG